MPTWFFVIILFGACFALPAAVRGLRGDGLYIAGERISRFTVLFVLIIIVISFAILAAIRFGFIPNHAP